MLKKIEPMKLLERYGWHIVLLLLFLSCVVLLLGPVVSIPYLVPRDWNEGYYAILQMRVFGPGPLYPDADGFLVNAYTPLSFYVVAGLSSIIGDNIIAGRVIALLSYISVSAGIGLITYYLCRSMPACSCTSTAKSSWVSRCRMPRKLA